MIGPTPTLYPLALALLVWVLWDLYLRRSS